MSGKEMPKVRSGFFVCVRNHCIGEWTWSVFSDCRRISIVITEFFFLLFCSALPEKQNKTLPDRIGADEETIKSRHGRPSLSARLDDTADNGVVTGGQVNSVLLLTGVVAPLCKAWSLRRTLGCQKVVGGTCTWCSGILVQHRYIVSQGLCLPLYCGCVEPNPWLLACRCNWILNFWWS